MTKIASGGQETPVIYQSLFLWRLALVRLRRLCLFIFKRRFFLRLPILYDYMMFVEIEKRPVPSI